MYPYEKAYDHVVTLTAKDRVATITFDCPQNQNRVSEQLVDEFGRALDDVRHDEQVRAVVLRGTGPVSFGAGDLGVIRTKLAKDLRTARQVMHEVAAVVRRMYDLPKPIIGLAEGACLGGGANLLLSCDLVVASDRASFHELFVDYALSPDCGGLWALHRLVSPMQARALAMLGEPVTARDAGAMGLVYRVVPAGEAEQVASALAERLAAKSPVGLAHIKQISNRLPDYSMETYFQVEADYMALGALSQDFREAAAAAAEGRAPQFRGV